MTATTFNVETDGNIAVFLLDRDFMDGPCSKLFEHGYGELFLQILPVDIPVTSYGTWRCMATIQNGHVLRRLKDVLLKGTGVGEMGIGESEAHLAYRLAAPACRAPYYRDP